MNLKKFVCKKHYCTAYDYANPKCPYCEGLLEFNIYEALKKEVEVLKE